MASIQDEDPIKEVTKEQVEKSTEDDQTPVIEEKQATSEEAEVIVHEDDDNVYDDNIEEIHNEFVKEEEKEEDKFAGSPIIGEDEPNVTFDEEGSSEAEVEEGDMI